MKIIFLRQRNADVFVGSSERLYLLLPSVLAAALLWKLHLSLATVGLKGTSSICTDGMGRGGMEDAENSCGMWLLSGNALIT